MGFSRTYYDLRDALIQDGCPICRLTIAQVTRSIDALNYESVGDLGVRAQLRKSLGYCNVHAYQWLHSANVLGTAQIYTDVISILNEELAAVSFRRRGVLADVASRLSPRANPSAKDETPAILEPTGECLICHIRAEAEQLLVRALLEYLPNPELSGAYAGSVGLCLPHLRLALHKARDEPTFIMLRDHAVAQQRRVVAQLQEIARKHDYRFQDEPAGDERGAGERAIRHVIGAPGIDR